MKQKILCFALFSLMCLILQEIPSVEGYKNYTVGDSSGWFAKSNLDYQKWVSGKSFSLGDFLVFNTDSNHTVIQTFNSTTYNSCDSQGDDNVQWSSIDPNSTVIRPITVHVPLMKEGVSYFFSGDYDGEQCMNGQKFSINVTHGQGLPPSLRDNPDFAVGSTPDPLLTRPDPDPTRPITRSTPTSAEDSAPGPDANPDSGDDQSVPDTNISSDFNHPKNIPEDSTSGSDEEDDDTKKSNNGAIFMPMFFVSLIGVLLLIL
ncbi:early nodulin-like protein 18 [Spinacia oleracea]|uniref:Early nodulin-like protein 18 n=1 Tax=Spinacia oleracea TaxID=3562 RepID=A0A9R0I6C7_SPIOL|nr:early nodulin-like protein 18 [Spinacia oleracea]